MKIRLQDGLPFVTAVLMHQNQQITLENVLLDTGSVGTIFPTDRMLEIGLCLEDEAERVKQTGGAVANIYNELRGLEGKEEKHHDQAKKDRRR